MAELGLAAFGASKDATEILTKIITTIRDAVRLKTECAEIEVVARTCLQILQERQSTTFDSRVAQDFQNYLTEVLKFVVECKDSSVFHRPWEVAWHHRLPSLKQQFITWLAFLSAETTLASRENLLQLIETTRGDESRSKEQFNVIISKLDILDDIKKNQANERAGALVVDFEESDSRLTVSPSGSGDNLRGTLEAPDGNTVPVVCEAVQESLMRYGEKGPRHVLIYSRLSENTRVLALPAEMENDGRG